MSTQERRRNAETKLARVNNGKLLSRLDPLATAFHETAHVIFHTAFGVEVKWATCMPYNSEKHGFCLGFVSTNADQVLLPGLLHVVETLSGDVAEWPLFHSEPWRPGYISGSDANSIIAMMAQMDA